MCPKHVIAVSGEAMITLLTGGDGLDLVVTFHGATFSAS